MTKKRHVIIITGLISLAFAGILVSAYLDIRNSWGPYPQLNAACRILAVILLLCACAGAFFFLIIRKKPSFPAACALTFFVLGALYSAVLPPFSSPDERAHFASAYALSDILLFQDPFSENGKLMMREEDLFTSDGNADGKMANAYLSENVSTGDYLYILNASVFTDRTQMVETDYTSDVFVSNMLARLPQAVGLTVGRLLHLSYVGVLYLGRLFGLLFFAFVFYLALRIIPRGQTALAAVGFLPMTLSQAGSYSYDVLILSLTFLYFAYVLKLRYQEGQITPGQAVLVILLLLAFTPWKMIYAVMALLLFMLPMSKFRSRRMYILCILATVVTISAAVLLVNGTAAADLAAGTDTSLEQGGNTYTLAYYISHPKTVIKMIFATFNWQIDFYYDTMIGQYPGKLDITLEIPDVVISALACTLVLAGTQTAGDKPVYGKREGITAASVVILVVALTMLSMAIGWTLDTSIYIQGVQGRYFLYILPLVLWFIGNTPLSLRRDIRWELLYAWVLLNSYAVMNIVRRVSLLR